MSATTTPTHDPAVEVVSPEGRTSTVLKRDALGLSALFFCIATAAAPLTALLFNVPVIVSGAGWAVPAAFIVATLMLLVFSVGYLEMARQVILGEGQILDVFKIVYDLAPDEATRRIVLLARRDEARHVSYGVARLRHRLDTARDPEAVGRQVVDWIAARAESSDEFFALPELVHEALGVLGRRVGIDGRERARQFPDEANRFRLSRLEAAGLPPRALRRARELLAS